MSLATPHGTDLSRRSFVDLPSGAAQQPKLLDRVRQALRLRHYSRRTEESYVGWIRRFILFHGKRPLTDMGGAEITAFLTSLATRARVSASTQNQALSALLFLYRGVLGTEPGAMPPIVRARPPERLPVVLSRDEVAVVMGQLGGTIWIMVALLYGSGLRLSECLALRVKDLDFDRRQLVIRRGKGQKDRLTMLPTKVKTALEQHLAIVRQQHARDLERGVGRVVLPFALERSIPTRASTGAGSLCFPAARICRDARWGRRHDSIYMSRRCSVRSRRPCGGRGSRSG
jgi:integrase